MPNGDDPKGTGPTSPMEGERLRRRSEARRERIVQAICDNSRLKPSERRHVAENLWRIMEDVRRHRPDATHARILQHAGRGTGTDSTKYGYYYLVDPNWPATKKADRTGKLTQTLPRYREIAQAAAELAGFEDRDAYLFDLVRGTRIEAEIESSMPPEDPRREGWEALCRCITMHADKIAHDYGLSRYFALQAGWQMCFRDGSFEPGVYRREEPSVFLGWVEPRWHRRGTLEFTAIPPDDLYGTDTTEGDRVEFAELNQPGALDVQVHVHSVVVLHLVLAPEGTGGALIPCLRARCITYVASAESLPQLVPAGGKAVERGTILALCNRALLGPTALSASRLPDSLQVAKTPVGRPQATVHYIGENELWVSPGSISGLLNESAHLTIEGDGPAVLAPFASEDGDAPRLLEPFGESALALLDLPVSWTPMRLSQNEEDRRWLAQASRAPLHVQRGLVFFQADACLGGEQADLGRAAAIAARATPFRTGTMLAALGRAMWSEPDAQAANASQHGEEPLYAALRRSTAELTSALDIAVRKAEAQWDAGLQQSLLHHDGLRQRRGDAASEVERK